MSLFDEVLDDGSFDEQPFGPQEGFAGVLLGASACDGHIADEEVQSLMTILHRMKLYSRISPNQFGSIMDRLMGLLKRGGPEKLLAASVPAVPPELRETAFANAVDIVLADGVVDPEEKTFIDNLAAQLEMDEKRSLAIIKVMVFKNKG